MVEHCTNVELERVGIPAEHDTMAAPEHTVSEPAAGIAVELVEGDVDTDTDTVDVEAEHKEVHW